MRHSTASLLLTLTLLPSLHAYVVPQDLVDLVPSDAHLVVHAVSDPELQFLEDYSWEVYDAVRDARFDELLLDVMADAGAPEHEIEGVRQARDMIVTLLGSVDWWEMVKNEIVYAQEVRPVVPGTLMPSMLFVCRPDAAKVDGLEHSLATLLATMSSLSEDNLRFVRTVSTEEANAPHIYQLCVEPLGGMPLLQMAVFGDKLLLGVGQHFFDRSVALMDGSSSAALTSSERFTNAMGDLPKGCSQVTFVDMQGMMGGYRDGLIELLGNIGVSDTGLSVVDDLHGLIDCIDTVAEAVHAEGSTVIKESWVRYNTGERAAKNPVLAGMHHDSASDQLLGFVPAEATAFRMHSGFDPRPVYDWALDRYNAYVPDADKHMIVWNGIQAAFDMSVRDDLLSWLGSPSVMVSLPGSSAIAGDEWVSISLLDDHKAAKKVMMRFEAVFEAIVPPLLSQLRAEAGDAAGMLPTIRIENAGASSGMRKVVITAPFMPVPPVYYGVTGRLLVASSSEDGFEHVMSVAAGEADGIDAHPLLTGSTALPGEELVAASLTPWGRHLDQLRAGIQFASGMLPGMVAGMSGGGGNSNPEVEAMMKLGSGVLTRVNTILSHVDFLKHGVTYTVAREEGRVHYSRKATAMLSPEERAQRRGR
ncbi:MAG: hypothetical protein DHS20C15_33190 [Planctomycetota bacterium]|nr:MAG: hypothetical protein DHS20C15_33190 [Planctomycetota bacterium]